MARVSEWLPLREPTFFILLSLARGDKHGYAIMKDVDDLSRGRVKLSTGTLYGALKRLLEYGWILRADDPDPNDSGRVRKSYQLSNLGQHVLNAEVKRLDQLVAAAHLRAVGENA